MAHDRQQPYGDSPRKRGGRAYAPLMPRVMERTKQNDDGCWVWQRYTMKTGYATITWNGKSWLVHRAVYTELVGPIPDHLEIDHLCENKACCNPKHLELVTRRENMARSMHNPAAVNALKTHCHKGHEFTEENTIVRWQERYGCWARWCRQCRKDYYEANKDRQLEQRRARVAARRSAA